MPVALDWGLPAGNIGGREAMADCGGGGGCGGEGSVCCDARYDCIAAMEWVSSWMATVICSIDIVEDEAAAEADGSNCVAVVSDGGGGGLVEVERGPDTSDTRLIGLGALPKLLRRL